MIDFGTIRPGTTLYIPFATYDSNDPSASVTITGLATTDIEVYKNGSVTQRASDSGYALLDTDGIDFDGTTGIHGISIDLSDNSTAGFWAAGAQYTVVIASITVDAATINFIAATFRIGYENALINTTIATLSSQTSFTLTSGPGDNDALNGCTCMVHDVASGVQVAQGLISDYTGSTKTVTLAADPGIFTMAATDNISIMPANLQVPKALPDAAGGLVVSDAGGLDIDTLNSNVSSILTDTGTTLDNHLTDIKGTGFVKDTHSLVDIEAYADLIDDGTSGLAKIATDVAAILVDTADIQPKLGTVSDLGGGATVGANLSDMAGATFSTTTDTLEAIRDRGDAEWTTGAGGSDRLLMVDTTIATLSTQTSFTLTAGSTDDDAYNGCTIVIEDVSTATQKAIGIVDDYTGSTKTVTLLEDPAVFTMATTDKVYILAEKGIKPTTAANYHLDISAGGEAGIDWANIGSPTTSVDLSGTDIQLCDTVTTLTGHTAQTGDTFALANGAAGFVAIDTVVDAILVDTAEIGAAGAGLTAVPYNSAWDAEIQSECNDALVALGLDHLVGAAAIGTDVVDNSIFAKLVSSSATADWDDFVNTTDSLQATRDAITTAQTDLDTITGADGVNLLSATQASIDAIEADTNELQGDWVNGGRLDLIIDAILVDTGTTIPATITTAQNDLDIITGTDGVTLATAQGNYAPATATAMAAAQTDLDTITDTGVTCVAITSAAFTDIWATDTLTEAYAADGAAATPAQAVYLIMQHLGESSISGTTKTVKKLDGSTSAATFTLDDGSSPTSITRAT